MANKNLPDEVSSTLEFPQKPTKVVESVLFVGDPHRVWSTSWNLLWILFYSPTICRGVWFRGQGGHSCGRLLFNSEDPFRGWGPSDPSSGTPGPGDGFRHKAQSARNKCFGEIPLDSLIFGGGVHAGLGGSGEPSSRPGQFLREAWWGESAK